jgi:acetoin:2,6-dichlorophenolindophenol oxidoreductase subunit alpha
MVLSLDLYRKLYLIKKSEDKIADHYLENEMKTPMHMSRGGESIPVGIIAALGDRGQVTCTYRTHASYLAITEDTDAFFLELFGKNGTAMGKAGSMHLCDPDSGLVCSTAIVGTNIPVGLGVAFSNLYNKSNKIVAIFFGDGAVDEGVFWESLNFACLKKLPVIFVYEDNGYAVHSPTKERHGYDSLCSIVDKFDCEVFDSSSIDVENVYHFTKYSMELIDRRIRPVFMRFQYYRYLEHVGVFDDFNQGYRDKEELIPWFKKDPIPRQRSRLISEIGKEQVILLEEQTRDKIDLSFTKAKAAGFADKEELYRDVFA